MTTNTLRRRGFSLVDVIVSTALLLIVFLALFGVLRASLALSSLAKAKSAAIELASTQIEYLRGVSYDALGTVGGIPSGAIPQITTSTVDGVLYTTRTFVEYYDNPADGSGIQDTNGVTTDYKVGKVTISYTLHGLDKSVVLVSNFVPPGIESSTGGGTLSLHVVNAAGAGLNDADVHIVNTDLSPAVDLTTFSDSNGLVLIGGVATSSEYQIYVSRAGYSSAQTYERVDPNVNPTPGYLTVVKDQTTGATFAIDVLSSLTLASFAPALTTSFNDTFTDASNLTNQVGTQVVDDTLTLTNEALSGSARSIPITPGSLTGWGILSADISAPPGTIALVRIGDAAGTPLPDSALPGNGAGFSSFPVSLTGIATTSYPGLTIGANFNRTDFSATSSLSSWSLSHTEGPTPLQNIMFSLTGAKTIGTDANDQSLYKTMVSDTTGAGGSVTKTLEYDAYTLALSGSSLIESCPTSPYALAAGVASSTALIVGALTTNTLPVVVENSTGSAVAGAKVVLERSGYAATVLTSPCGLAFFNDLASDTYGATVLAAGYTTTVFPSLVVAGHTVTTILTLP